MFQQLCHRFKPGTEDWKRAGTPLCDFKACLVSVQGDLDFFSAALGLPRWNLKAGGCPVCRCQDEVPMTWKQFADPHHVQAMEWLPQEWLSWEGRTACPLFEAKGVTGCTVMLDWMHIKYLGNDQYVYASVFHLLVFVLLFGKLRTPKTLYKNPPALYHPAPPLPVCNHVVLYCAHFRITCVVW